jgi:hypothetical protein
MATKTPFAELVKTPLNAAGVPTPGAQFKFYLTGTSTPTPVYDMNGASLGTVVTADADGQFVAIFGDPAITYRVDLQDASSVSFPHYPVDNVTVPPVTGSVSASGLDIIQIESLLG